METLDEIERKKKKRKRHDYNNFGRIIRNIGEGETHITSHIFPIIHIIFPIDFFQNRKKEIL